MTGSFDGETLRHGFGVRDTITTHFKQYLSNNIDITNANPDDCTHEQPAYHQ